MPVLRPGRSSAGLVLRGRVPAAVPLAQAPGAASTCESTEGRAAPERSLGRRRENNIRGSPRSQLEEGGRRL